MNRSVVSDSYTCARCLKAYRRQNVTHYVRRCGRRALSTHSPLRDSAPGTRDVADETASRVNTTNGMKAEKNAADVRNEVAMGAMSRRLADATEDAILEGGRAGRKAVDEAGFSEELKQRLLDRIQTNTFRSENASAFAEAGLTGAAGRGTRDIAAAQAWTGTESVEDAALRMLHDAHKPLRPGLRGPARIGNNVDMRIKKEPKRTAGQRIANARDKASVYAIPKDSGMTEQEREAMRKEFKERFQPAGRAMPTTFTGLAALANERIEDAIARGQFKNIPRGKAIVRDPRADNPFIDTTEYIMNKMIQRQEIVPPWIEKQQELVRTANVFRARLRNDWKRHAARTIASRGGSLQEQVKLANRYAEAERLHNPKTRKVEEISVPTNMTDDPVMVKITQEAQKELAEPPPPTVQLVQESKAGEIPLSDPQPIPAPLNDAPPAPSPDLVDAPSHPLPPPFRDPEWQKNEHSYHVLAISNLNTLTRSYNLMAPDLAKKPYFNLERELRSCYADVAPQLGQMLIERAARPAKELVEKVGHRPGGVLERFGGETARVYDSRKPLYGFKEFWNDLFGGKKDGL